MQYTGVYVKKYIAMMFISEEAMISDIIRDSDDLRP